MTHPPAELVALAREVLVCRDLVAASIEALGVAESAAGRASVRADRMAAFGLAETSTQARAMAEVGVELDVQAGRLKRLADRLAPLADAALLAVAEFEG